MKMVIQKSFAYEVDTGKERQRINRSFKRNKTIQKKLLKLMDLVEQQKWAEAEAELDSKWWCGRDKELECPRLEFIGMLHSESPEADSWDTYIQLICRMNRHPEIYKVINTVGK